MADLENFHRCFHDEDAMKYYHNGFSLTIDESRKKVAEAINHWNKHAFGDWLVIDQSKNGFIGFCGFDNEIDPGHPNLGYAFLREAWGKGFAAESAARVIQYGFEELKFDEIRAYSHPENHASIAILKKCNMSHLDNILFDGQPRMQFILKNHHREE